MMMKMKIRSEIKVKYKDTENAEIAFKTLDVDNKGFVESELKSNEINFKIESDNLGSFLNTADDLIASEILVENILKKTDEK